MTESELSKLAYLGVAIANNPRKTRALLQVLEDKRLRRPSPEMRVGLNIFEKFLGQEEKKVRRTCDRVMLTRIADRMFRMSGSAKSVGRSLFWGLEYRSGSDFSRSKRS